MKPLFIAAAALIASPAAAEIVTVPATGSVQEVADKLQTVVEGAGATIFARVDHAGGAKKVGEELAPAELLIFGNPKLGTPAIQADPFAGIVLPLRVLIYETEDGKTMLAYEDVDALFDGMSVPGDAAVRANIGGALEKLTGVAAGN